MPLTSSILLLAVASGRLAVLGVASNDGEPLPRTGALTQALKAQGASLLAQADVRGALLCGARQRVEGGSPDAEALLLNVSHAFDGGDFQDAIRRAQAGELMLARDPPSARREALRRQLEILWGGALVQVGRRAEAAAHFGRALEQEPEATIDRNRFPPPVQEAFERARGTALLRKRVSLEVHGPAGATVFVDGLPRSVLPEAPSVIPHRTATIWLEWQGQASLAREVQLEAAPTMPIFDTGWGLEAALRESTTELGVALPRDAGARRELLALVGALAKADRLVLVERAGALVRISSVDGVGSLRLVAERPIVGVDWTEVAHELLTSDVPRPAAVAAAPVLASEVSQPSPAEVPPAATAVVAPARPFPWLTVGLIAGGALVIAGAFVLAASIHSTNAVLLGPTQAMP